MLEYPDSALLLLEDIGVEELTTLDCRARYALLLTQAKDKNYILHHDDSLIRIAVNFYDSTENTFLRAKSHYYWGRVYQDRKNVAAAAREFLTAMPLAKKIEDNDLMSLLQSNLGYIY